MPRELSKRMALSIDVDRGLRRPADLVTLAEAVVAGKDEDEADWVEWKSTLDLTSSEGQFRWASAPRPPGSPRSSGATG